MTAPNNTADRRRKGGERVSGELAPGIFFRLHREADGHDMPPFAGDLRFHCGGGGDGRGSRAGGPRSGLNEAGCLLVEGGRRRADEDCAAGTGEGFSYFLDTRLAEASLRPLGALFGMELGELLDRLARRALTPFRCEVPFLRELTKRLQVLEAAKRGAFLRLQLAELLLFLAQPLAEDAPAGARTAGEAQGRLVAAICAYQAGHLDEHLTLARLSALFRVSPGTIKYAFRAVERRSVYAHLRRIRMRGAARLLRQGESSILEIAGACGYNNGSKFARAFRDCYGYSPTAYRLLNAAGARVAAEED